MISFVLNGLIVMISSFSGKPSRDYGSIINNTAEKVSVEIHQKKWLFLHNQ